jgi:hypothetical protein
LAWCISNAGPTRAVLQYLPRDLKAVNAPSFPKTSSNYFSVRAWLIFCHHVTNMPSSSFKRLRQRHANPWVYNVPATRADRRMDLLRDNGSSLHWTVLPPLPALSQPQRTTKCVSHHHLPSGGVFGLCGLHSHLSRQRLYCTYRVTVRGCRSGCSVPTLRALRCS